MLGQMGLIVDTASNGKQALEVYYAAKKPYDLVISDLTMPIMGGLELLDQIKAKNQQLDAPRPAKVLLSTGLPDFVVDSDRYPMVIGLLNKPFNLALLRKKLLAAGLAGVPVSDQERKQKTR